MFVVFGHLAPAVRDLFYHGCYFCEGVPLQDFCSFFLSKKNIGRGAFFGRDRVRAPVLNLLHVLVELLLGDVPRSICALTLLRRAPGLIKEIVRLA